MKPYLIITSAVILGGICLHLNIKSLEVNDAFEVTMTCQHYGVDSKRCYVTQVDKHLFLDHAKQLEKEAF